ncbi:MAG: LacI family transcriptional regulator [Planctomycetaceae bacterium]|nr:LacI family transcriptional regulator [Planctomycetaceae bacterium]
MSIARIAELAGVSVATVSNVLNSTGRVSPETAQKVRKIAQEANFKIRRKRRNGSQGRKRIAFSLVDRVLRFEQSNWVLGLMGSAQQVIEPHGYSLTVLSTATAENIAKQTHDAAAVILYGYDPQPEPIIAAAGKPVIWIMRYNCNPADAVMEDNREMGRMVAEYFVARGHQHIGYIADTRIEPVVDRGIHMAQYASEIKCKTTTVGDNQIFTNEQGLPGVDVDKLHRLLDKLLKGAKRPTALFVPGDLMTIHIYAALQKRGIRPMKDIDIVSCNNETIYYERLDPRPPVIDIDIGSIGKLAAQTALWRLENPDMQPTKVLLTPRLLIP